MRILYLAHRIPYPPNKGDKIRVYHQLRHLARRHEIDLLTLYDVPEDREGVGPLEELCRSVEAVWLPPAAARLRAAAALATGRPFSPAFFRQPELRRRLARRLQAQRYDLMILFCSGVGELLPRSLRTRGVPLIADYCDLDSAKWRALGRASLPPRSWLYGTEGRRLARYERHLASDCNRIVFATPLEADDFCSMYADVDVAAMGRRVTVIPNGVDHDHFARDDEPSAEMPTVVFTGAMDYRPNWEGAEWFLDRVWPAVRERVPEARLQVVGREPPARLRARDGRIGTEVTGTVPDIRPYLHGAWISVAPLRIARGVQNKVLEAMAAEVPTVISPAVARGLEARHGTETIVADRPLEWAREIVGLIGDELKRRRLGRRGLEYVRRQHTWPAHGAAWEALVAKTVGSRRREALA